ncbi:MAG: ABC transporter substrate-binding protein, partial [Aestuariivirgaceae bacterium]
YHILVFPAGMKDEAFSKGIGTGAYMLENFDPGVITVAKKNPNDYRSDRGHFDSVEMIAMNDATSRMNALSTGAVHAISRADKKTLNLLKRNKQMEVHDVTGNQHYTFPMLTKVAPFDNEHVRLALKWGINRAEMVQKILQGHGAVGNDHPIGPANQYLAKPEDIGGQREYDPDKAKFHLKKAGLDSLKVDLSSSDGAFAGAVDASVLYQASAAKAGIDINVVRESADGYWSNVWLKKPWCACYWSGRATEDWMFNTAYEKGVPWNDSQWEHEKFNKLLLEARAELNSDKRRDLYREMQLITKDEGGVVVPMYANYVYASSKKVAHPETVGNIWTMDGARMIERWWMA